MFYSAKIEFLLKFRRMVQQMPITLLACTLREMRKRNVFWSDGHEKLAVGCCAVLYASLLSTICASPASLLRNAVWRALSASASPSRPPRYARLGARCTERPRQSISVRLRMEQLSDHRLLSQLPKISVPRSWGRLSLSTTLPATYLASGPLLARTLASIFTAIRRLMEMSTIGLSGKQS